jgi:hypothetical protein
MQIYSKLFCFSVICGIFIASIDFSLSPQKAFLVINSFQLIIVTLAKLRKAPQALQAFKVQKIQVTSKQEKVPQAITVEEPQLFVFTQTRPSR